MPLHYYTNNIHYAMRKAKTCIRRSKYDQADRFLDIAMDWCHIYTQRLDALAAKGEMVTYLNRAWTRTVLANGCLRTDNPASADRHLMISREWLDAALEQEAKL